MSYPLIKQWQSRPPAGGWGIKYELLGQVWTIDGPTPQRIVEQIAQIQRQNRAYSSHQAIWDYCNAIWTERDPARAVVQKASPAPRGDTKPVSTAHWEHGPEKFGPILWFWLHHFGMVFDQEGWNYTINRITLLLDPDKSPGHGCDRCFNEWKVILATEKPFEVTNEEQAAKWSYNVHTRINKKLGKPNLPFFVAARMYGWKVPV